MGLFSGLFGKKAKSNLTPDVTPYYQSQLALTNDLRPLVQNRLRGNDLGFGEDFLSKTSNPVMAQRQARFQNEEIPRINSELSSRGFARSAGAPGTATDSLIKAGQSNQRDLDEIMSKFYLLNEQQKKTDDQRNIGEANILQDQEADMQMNVAGASERLSGRTQQQQETNRLERNSAIDQGGDRLFQALGGAIGGDGMGSLFSNFGGSSGYSESDKALIRMLNDIVKKSPGVNLAQ